MLYIVATPIGNLEDITLRAIRTLKEVDIVLAEDTRKSKILFNKYDIKTQLLAFHSYSSDKTVDNIINKLLNGEQIALISDAGTPGISDPLFKLIIQVINNKIEVIPIPGVSAVITALSVSGAPIDKFLYLGFIPIKKGRSKLLQSLITEKRTVVIYESVHRINKTLDDLYSNLGDRYVCVAREMTKMHEEFFRGSLQKAVLHFQKTKNKGEFTIIIAPANFHAIINV